MYRAVTFLVIFIVAACSAFPQAPKKINRISPSLIREMSFFRGDSADITISFKNTASLREWIKGKTILHEYAGVNTATIRIPRADLGQLENDSTIIFANVKRVPKEEFASGNLDLSVNRINVAHRYFQQADGFGVNVSLKEQRFDSSDIDIRGRFFNSEMASPTQSTHASAMASVIAGAGNSTPASKGVATGARITSSDFQNLFPDDSEVYKKHNITVQNHSYGTDIENFYGADAAAFDESTFNNAQLLHVFSAGNLGYAAAPDGEYEGISGYANLTGSFKMSKNSIVVGATDSFNVVMDLSSKGPAYDGRVKPEIVAFGEDGTSGAAALVSGASILVQQLHKQLFGNISTAALTKAILLNTARGNAPNFSSGYGSLEVFGALNAVTNHQFAESSISTNQQTTFRVTVPQNTRRAKFMLVWTDPSAAVNAVKALQNDLDLSVSKTSNAETWFPWVLNSSQTPGAILQPAIRKKDNLNNVEQVTVDNPLAGEYSINVFANQLVSAKQQFAITWVFDTAQHFSWTYPTSSDKPEAGKNIIIRWNTTIEGQALLEYSMNNEVWTTAKTISLADEYCSWSVPDISGKVKLRMKLPGGIIRETEQFISARPTNLQVGFNCSDSTLYYWSPVPGTSYTVYALGDKYLEPIFTTNDSFFVVNKLKYQSRHFAVGPQIAATPALRSYAVDYENQGVECYFQGFFASLQNINTVALELNLGSVFQVKKISFQKLIKNKFIDLFSLNIPNELSSNFVDEKLFQNENTYRTVITLANGAEVISGVQTVHFIPEGEVLIYPNPLKNNQSLNIICNEAGIFEMTLLDMNGRIVFSAMLDDTKKQVHVPQLARGIYFARFFSTGKKPFSKKIIIY